MSAKLLSISVIAAVILAAVALTPAFEHLSQTKPDAISVTEQQAQVSLSVDNTRVANDMSCLTASWHVSGARSVSLNGNPEPYVGQSSLCGEPPRLDVTFDDGSAKEYTLPREIVLTPEYRLLLLALLGFAVIGLWLALRPVRARLVVRLARFEIGFSELAADFRAFFAAESRVYLLALLAITAVGVALRLHEISKPMGLDEAYTYIYFASRPLWDGLSNYALPNNHLFHTLLVHVSTGLLGNAPWTVRLPAFAAGVLMIPATYIAARALYNHHAAILAAAAVAIARPLITYSTNARGYTLVGLFFLLLLALAVYLRHRRNSAGWALFALFTTLGFYTVPIMLYPFGIVALWLFLTICVESRGQQRLLLIRNLVVASVAAGVATLVLYLPAIERSGLHAVIGNQWVASLTLAQFTTGFPGFLNTIRQEWNAFVVPAIVQLVLIGFIVGALWYALRGRFRVPLLAVAVVWIGATMAVQRVLPFSRVFLFLLPLGLMIACAGWVAFLEWLPRGPRTALVIAGASALIAWGAPIALHNSTAPVSDGDMEPMAAYLQTQLRPGDKATIVLVEPNLEYYFRLHEYNVSYLRANNAATRVFVIVNRAARQNPDYVLTSGRINPAGFGLPHLLASFGNFDIYVTNARLARSAAFVPPA